MEGIKGRKAREGLTTTELRTPANIASMNTAQAPPKIQRTTGADVENANSTSSITTSKKRKYDEADESSEPSTPSKRGRNGKMARKECVLCCVDVLVNQYPRLPHKTANAHDRGVCLKCWEIHLVSEVSSKGWDAASCPQCTEVLSEAEMKKIASGKTYETQGSHRSEPWMRC